MMAIIRAGEKMNLYLISQDENDDYDTYDSAVVVAATPEDAAKIHPRKEFNEEWGGSLSSWASSPDKVEVKLVGTAVSWLDEGSVVCSSFNAG